MKIQRQLQTIFCANVSEEGRVRKSADFFARRPPNGTNVCTEGKGGGSLSVVYLCCNSSTTTVSFS